MSCLGDGLMDFERNLWRSWIYLFLDFEHHNLNFLLEIIVKLKKNIYQALYFPVEFRSVDDVMDIWHMFDWLICVVGV